MKQWMALAACAGAALIASCASSPPTHFYVLDPIPPAQPAGVDPDAPVQIASVTIPPALDRRAIVQESTPDSLEVDEQHRWAAPFGDMTQTVLTQDLIRRLPENKVILPRVSPPAGSYEATVSLLQFERAASGEIVLEGGWSLYRLGSDAPLQNHHVSLRARPATDDYSSQARTMSELLGRLSDEIVRALPTKQAATPQAGSN